MLEEGGGVQGGCEQTIEGGRTNGPINAHLTIAYGYAQV